MEKIKSIFLLIEFFLNEGEDSVKSTACVCFLENLINYASAGRLKPEQFIPYLGEKSKKFCKKWNEFTGVPTPGLWKKGEFKEQQDPVDGWLQMNNKFRIDITVLIGQKFNLLQIQEVWRNQRNGIMVKCLCYCGQQWAGTLNAIRLSWLLWWCID